MLLQTLQHLLPAVSVAVVLSLLVTVAAGLLFVSGLRSLERESEQAMVEARQLELDLAAQAASAPAFSRVCSVCGAPAPHRCKGCSVREYCGRECQLKDWKAGHKQQCKKLRRPQGGAATAAAATLAAAPASFAAAPSQQAVQTSKGSSVDSSSSGGSSAPAGPPAESNSTPPVPRTVIYPYDKFRALLVQHIVRRAPVGLQNAGNTCFANSLLQVLLATQPLAAYLLSGEHGEECHRRASKEWCLLCDMEVLAQQAQQAGGSSKAVLNPKQMLRNIKHIGKQFTFGNQEDSHELYIQMLDAMESSMLAQAGGKAKFDLRSRETTLVHHIFGGYLRSQVVCLSCGHASKTFEPSMGLELELPYPYNKTTRLEDALRHYTACERLDGKNKYKCDRCKSLVAAELSKRIEVAPNVLQICLKRHAMGGRYGTKLKTAVQFPEELGLEPYMADDSLDEQPAKYSLFGVVVHQGSSSSYGHYVSYVRLGDKWFSCNDESVVPVAASRVTGDSAYQLFYQRAVPREIPAGPRSSPPTPAKAAAAAAAAAASAAFEGAEAGGPVAAQGALGRVQTAPAALSHMSSEAGPAAAAAAVAAAGQLGSTGGSLGASSSSSLDKLTQHSQDPPSALPEAFHPSASESNLQLQRRGHQGASGQGAAVPAAVLEEGGEGGIGGGRGSSSSEGSEGGGDLAPAANPFELLRDSEEEGEGRQVGGSEQDIEAGAAAAAGVGFAAFDPCAECALPNGTAEQQHPACSTADRMGSSACASHTFGAPGSSIVGAACAAGAEGVSLGSLSGQQGACSLAEGPATPGDVWPNGALPSGALHAASPSHAPAGSEGPSGPHSQGQQDEEGSGGSAAGWAGPGSCSRAGGNSGAGAGSECVPAYRLEAKELDDGSHVVRLSVDLPGVQAEEIDLRVSDDRTQLWLGAAPFSATLALPARVEPAQRSVKWIKKSQRLVALFNVLPS